MSSSFADPGSPGKEWRLSGHLATAGFSAQPAVCFKQLRPGISGALHVCFEQRGGAGAPSLDLLGLGLDDPHALLICKRVSLRPDGGKAGPHVTLCVLRDLA